MYIIINKPKFVDISIFMKVIKHFLKLTDAINIAVESAWKHSIGLDHF